MRDSCGQIQGTCAPDVKGEYLVFRGKTPERTGIEKTGIEKKDRPK
jgi:hypothetical protein